MKEEEDQWRQKFYRKFYEICHTHRFLGNINSYCRIPNMNGGRERERLLKIMDERKRDRQTNRERDRDRVIEKQKERVEEKERERVRKREK